MTARLYAFENLVFNYQQPESTEHIIQIETKTLSKAHRATEVNKCIQNGSAQQ